MGEERGRGGGMGTKHFFPAFHALSPPLDPANSSLLSACRAPRSLALFCSDKTAISAHASCRPASLPTPCPSHSSATSKSDLCESEEGDAAAAGRCVLGPSAPAPASVGFGFSYEVIHTIRYIGLVDLDLGSSHS